ncbi:MAG: DUF5119 domain-containing protein [Muribaculaceae bacterium]|nr:DUF5119 domain-containing protein [Muribaculaceae bacterium]
MNYPRLLYMVAFAAVVSATTSCRDELCYDHYPALELSLSWEHEWERDYGMNHAANWDAELHGFAYNALKPGKPEWVTSLRYTADGNAVQKHMDPDGGKIILEDDNEASSLLLYNGDTEYIVLSDMASLPDARASATLRSRTSLSYVMDRHPGARSTNSPDVLYAAFAENVPRVELHSTHHLPLNMQPLVYTYVVHYEFDYGADYIAEARGALGGMAESVYLRDGSTSDQAVIVLYDCEVTTYGCRAVLRSFGTPGFPDEYYGKASGAASDRPYTLNLEVLLKNGKTKEFNFDVADQMANQPRGGVIRVKGMRVDDEEALYESGFDVDVSGWGNSEIVDLPLELEGDEE